MSWNTPDPDDERDAPSVVYHPGEDTPAHPLPAQTPAYPFPAQQAPAQPAGQPYPYAEQPTQFGHPNLPQPYAPQPAPMPYAPQPYPAQQYGPPQYGGPTLAPQHVHFHAAGSTPMVPAKDVGVAYLLWFFLGGIGIHKFYLNNPAMGVLYIFTCGLFGLGYLWDLFTIPMQVSAVNRRNGWDRG